jgi:hypothetical protein
LAQRARVGWARELSKGQQRAAFPAGGIASGRQVAATATDSVARSVDDVFQQSQVSKSWAVSHSHSYRQSGVPGRRRIRTCGTAPSKPSSQSRTSSRAAGAMAVAANHGARPRRTIPKSDDPVSRATNHSQPQCSQCSPSARREPAPRAPSAPVPLLLRLPSHYHHHHLLVLLSSSSSTPLSLARSLSLSLAWRSSLSLLLPLSPPPSLSSTRPSPGLTSPHLTSSPPVATLGRVALHCTLHAALCM